MGIIKDKEARDAWMAQYKAKEDADDKVRSDVSEKIIELLKNVDRVTCIPKILANVFTSIDREDTDKEITGLKNQIINWGIETYAGRKISKVIPRLRALYQYCVDKDYTEDNTWEWGGGDRNVCYIPAQEDKKVLLFENQNIQFVVVFDKMKVNVREVYKSLTAVDTDESFYSFKGQYFNSVAEFREGLKTEKGLEIAICNLTGRYTRFADSVEGNEYPDYIDLDTMKASNFGKECAAFRYGDNRDCGYLISMYATTAGFGDERCEINDINRTDYAFYDMAHATCELPKRYLKAIKRDDKLNKLGI